MDDEIDDILNSPSTKRKEVRESKSLDSSSELRRSTKSVTFVDDKDGSDDSDDGKHRTEPAAGKGGRRESNDFDDDEADLPLSGLDTPRSEDGSVAFPDERPPKSAAGTSSGGAAIAPKMGFGLFTTSSTVSEELAPKAKKTDFDSFLGNLGASAHSRTVAKDEDDLLNTSGSGGSAYQPWAKSNARPSTSETLGTDALLQGVDLTLKKRPGTAPVPAPVAAAAAAAAGEGRGGGEGSAKKTLSRLLVDDEDDLFATAPVRTASRQQKQPKEQQQQLSATVDAAVLMAGRQKASPPLSPTPTAMADVELLAPSIVQTGDTAGAASSAAAPSAAISLDDDDSALLAKRPPTGAGRRARRTGGDDLAGLFDSSGGGSAAEDFPSIPLSSEMKIEFESEIKKLRRERDDLRQHNEQLQQKLKDETENLEAAQRKKLTDMEELFKRREEMLLKENDQLKQKYLDTQRQADQDRASMRSDFNRQIDEFAQEKRRELELLREQHRNDVEALRSAAPHAGAISNLVDRLGHLSEKLSSLSDRESTHRLKDEVQRQAEQTDRQAMREILQSLKGRVDESARSERWLSDLATQLMEERRTLAAERSELRALKLGEGARQADSEAERLALAEERTRLQELEVRLRHSRGDVLRQKTELETLAEELKLREEKLKDGQRSLEERLEIVSRREKAQREQQARLEAAAVEQAEQAKRADGMQSRLAELRAKERDVSQALIQLAEERASLDKRAGGLLCASCRAPVKDSMNGGFGSALQLAGSVDSAFSRSRQWDDLEEEKLYLESLNHAPYG
ncbi:hypothetical protein BOX15_Mlig017040g3 [Macrostomum lignano]|uniref:Fas-binding factor 1 n=1 Tax=Macrostomum lignano TaxID=282301 RepID=A0A267FXZ3_9PLAT|nr:hypothetical protein BOX15_Mlig017040g3 [Macrostomum lignano]